MPATTYIPTQEGALDTWAATAAAVLTSAPTLYGIDAGQASSFVTLQTAYHDAYLLAGTNARRAINPAARTKVTNAAKVAAKAAMIFMARQIAQIAQTFPDITSDLLAAAGFTVRDPGGSPIPAPTSTPVLSVYDTDTLRVRLRYADSVLVNPRSKPFGAIGLRLWVKVGTVPPVTTDDCTFAGQFTKMPATLDFASGDGGKTAYVIGKWVTRTNLEGPPSSVFTATIPA